jgi:phospholipase/carboxylesterase
MTVDEAPDQLGQTLFIPPGDADRAADLKVMLPQFALPGEERFSVRELPFIHRFNRPESPDGTTLVLLHGTGGNEADLMPFARRIAPLATLLGVRGRAGEEGTNRWFRRTGTATFDQADIRSEAEAFTAFVEGAVTGYGLDPDRLVFLGYSNGASFLAAVIQLHPDVVRRAILLRAIQVTENPVAADLSATRVLILAGRDDALGPGLSTLPEDLTANGAQVEALELSAGHEMSRADFTEAAKWFRQNHSDT